MPCWISGNYCYTKEEVDQLSMSSELIEDCLDHKGNSVGLEMKASGYAILSIFGQDLCNSSESEEDSIVEFHLKPTEDGFKLAIQIENALKDWRKQVGVINGTGE